MQTDQAELDQLPTQNIMFKQDEQKRDALINQTNWLKSESPRHGTIRKSIFTFNDQPTHATNWW